MAMVNNRGKTEVIYPSASRWQPTQPTADLRILMYADDYYHSPSYVDQALQRLGLPYEGHYWADFSGFEYALANGTWDIVLFGDDNWPPPPSTLDALNTYVLNGGRLVFDSWVVSRFPGHSLWNTLGIAAQGDDYNPPAPVYWWDPTHVVFNDPESVPEFTLLYGGRYGTYGQYVEPLAGAEAIAGYTSPGPDPNQAALIIGNDGRTVFKAFIDGQNDADQDSDGTPDGVELWVNLIAGIQNGFPPPIPWLSVQPTSGTARPSQPQQVQVTVDATQLSPGNYAASLVIQHNSGRSQKLVIPISVKVVPYRVAMNAGGPTYIDTAKGEWSADQAWTGSGWGHVGTSTTLTTTTPVSGTTNPQLYATARHGQFEYRFAVPRSGSYQVELRFAEIQGLKADARVFNVKAEGVTRLLRHDIAAEKGKYKADVHVLNVQVNDGQLNIVFEPIPGKKLPLVNAIRVTRQL